MQFEYVLLALLANHPYSGYDLRKWVETEGQFLRSRAHHSQVYRLLSRMKDDGWVEYEVDERAGRPDAKVYRITAQGQRALMEWIRSPYDPPSRFQDPDFLSRFIFAAALDIDAAISLIRTELDYRRRQIARNRGRHRTPSFQDPVRGLDQDLFREVAEEMHIYGASAADRWLAWLELMQTRLELRRSERPANSIELQQLTESKEVGR
ncbi:PadR family transcriptional regulator [Nocardia goodfellowii]